MAMYVFYSLSAQDSCSNDVVYRHEPYPYWVKGKVCLLGDAGTFLSLILMEDEIVLRNSPSNDAGSIPRVLYGLRRCRRFRPGFPPDIPRTI